MYDCLLLADNKPEYRKSLLLRLRLEGYTVAEAESVDKAVEALSLSKPDLALVDLRLTDDDDTNDMSGLEVARMARGKGIPCIIITAFPSVEVVRLALRSRGVEPLAVDFVSKAEGPDALLDAIRVMLARKGTDSATDNDALILDT